MRTNLIFLALFAITSLTAKVQADDRVLGDVMKDVAAEVKVVSAQLDNRDQNKDSTERSLKMRKLFIEAFNYIPEKVTKAPEADRPGLMRAYDKFLGQIIMLTSDLEENFTANDNVTAKKTFAEIGKVKRAAHDLLQEKK